MPTLLLSIKFNIITISSVQVIMYLILGLGHILDGLILHLPLPKTNRLVIKLFPMINNLWEYRGRIMPLLKEISFRSKLEPILPWLWESRINLMLFWPIYRLHLRGSLKMMGSTWFPISIRSCLSTVLSWRREEILSAKFFTPAQLNFSDVIMGICRKSEDFLSRVVLL